MGHGTIVKVYASRIHRCNAEQTAYEAKEVLDNIERTLIAMAASRGEATEGCMWYEHVAREVPELLKEFASAVFSETLATAIIENPEDADDDYDDDRHEDEIPEARPDATQGGAA